MDPGGRPCQEQLKRIAAEFGPRQTYLWRFFLVVDFLVASSAALGSGHVVLAPALVVDSSVDGK